MVDLLSVRMEITKRFFLIYKKLVLKYYLCPRGVGPNTIRFWESLQAGAIPVLISDNMALPKGFNWDNCIIRIREKDILSINSILVSISPKKEEEMRENCLIAYELFLK